MSEYKNCAAVLGHIQMGCVQLYLSTIKQILNWYKWRNGILIYIDFIHKINRSLAAATDHKMKLDIKCAWHTMADVWK